MFILPQRAAWEQLETSGSFWEAGGYHDCLGHTTAKNHNNWLQEQRLMTAPCHMWRANNGIWFWFCFQQQKQKGHCLADLAVGYPQTQLLCANCERYLPSTAFVCGLLVFCLSLWKQPHERMVFWFLCLPCASCLLLLSFLLFGLAQQFWLTRLPLWKLDGVATWLGQTLPGLSTTRVSFTSQHMQLNIS